MNYYISSLLSTCTILHFEAENIIEITIEQETKEQIRKLHCLDCSIRSAFTGYSTSSGRFCFSDPVNNIVKCKEVNSQNVNKR